MFVLIMGVIGSKSRSPGQILVKFSLHSLSYIFGLSTVTQVSDAGPSWPLEIFLLPAPVEGFTLSLSERIITGVILGNFLHISSEKKKKKSVNFCNTAFLVH